MCWKMIFQMLTIGLCTSILFSAIVKRDFDVSIDWAESAKKQLQIFKRICKLVGDAGKTVSPGSMPDKLKTELISLLQQAAVFSTGKSQLNYLHRLVKNFKNNRFTSPFYVHSLHEEDRLDIIFVSSSDNKKLVVYVLVTKPDATRFAGDSLRIGLELAENYPAKTKQSGLFFPENSLIRVCNVYCASQVDRMVLNIPLISDRSRKNQFELILLEDVIRGYYDAHVRPLGESILDAGWRAKINFQAYYTALLLHRISHFYGPVEVTIQKTQLPVNERLKDLLYVFEEIRADTAFLANLSLWENQEPAIKKQEVFTTFLVALIDRLKFDFKGKSTLPYLIEFNYLMKQGGCFYDLNQRSLSVDIKKFSTAVKMLLTRSLQVLQQGNFKEAESFIKPYSKTSKVLKELLGNYEKSRLPKAAAENDE